jgi:hypothetical protein
MNPLSALLSQEGKQQMAAEVFANHDILALAQLLREQFDSHALPVEEGGEIRLSGEIYKNLLETLDELTISAERSHGPDGDFDHELLTSRQVDTVERTLAKFQAGITMAFGQAAAMELREHLQSAEQLNASLKERELHLADQLQLVQSQYAQLIEDQSRLTRQRKSAVHALRARRAEMLLQVEREREQVKAELRRELEQFYADQFAGQSNEAVEQLRKQLHDEQAYSTALQERIDEASSEKKQLKRELEGALENAKATGAASSEHVQQLAQLREELDESQMEVQLAREELESKTRLVTEHIEKLAGLESRIESTDQELSELREVAEKHEREARELNETREQLVSLQAQWTEREATLDVSEELEAIREQLQQTQMELEHAQLHISELENEAPAEDLTERVAQLTGQLASALDELEDLRGQNSDLASQIAKQQVVRSVSTPHVSFEQETLSWEERKKLIMQQLESEACDEPEPEDQERRVEIERVLQATEREIARRDHEIEELQSIIEQQSDTRQGVAIGAAAIAQMFDTDELIQQERQKLKEIQLEWETKLRQAEIDLSMERAKLARERTQLESELEEAKRCLPADAATEVAKGGRTRKWLEHLGLKDENKGS